MVDEVLKLMFEVPTALSNLAVEPLCLDPVPESTVQWL